jgi:hypothetical protein
MPYSTKQPVKVKGSPQGDGPKPTNQQSQGKRGAGTKDNAGEKRTQRSAGKGRHGGNR